MFPLTLILLLQENLIFWFVDASIYSVLIIKKNSKSIWCDLSFTLSIVLVVHCISIWPSERYAFWVNWNELLSSMVSASGFFFPSGYSFAFQIQNINLGQPTPQRLYPYMTSQTHQFLIIEGYLISNVNTIWYWPFVVFYPQLWWVPPHEMLDS